MFPASDTDVQYIEAELKKKKRLLAKVTNYDRYMCTCQYIMILNIKVLGIGFSKSGAPMVSLWFGESILFDFTIVCQSFAKIQTFICLSLDLDQSSLLQLTQQPL